MASTIASMSKEAPPSRSAPQFVVRLPDEEFRKKIAIAAEANNRSMNAEIVERLSSSLQGDERLTLMRSDRVLLRALADFVLLRNRHPELMAGPMESAILGMASAIKAAGDIDGLFAVAEPSFIQYVRALTASVERLNDQLGPGWAKPKSENKDVDRTKRVLVGNLGENDSSHIQEVLRVAGGDPPLPATRKRRAPMPIPPKAPGKP